MNNKSWMEANKRKHNRIQKEIIKSLNCCKDNIKKYEETGIQFIL